MKLATASTGAGVRGNRIVGAALALVAAMLLSLLSFTSPAHAAPAAPVIDSARTSLPSSGDVVMAWHPVPGAQQYFVEISASPTFSSTLFSSNTGKTVATSITPVFPIPTGTWYWRVAAKDADGTMSDWRSSTSFTRSVAVGPSNLRISGLPVTSAQTVGYPAAPVLSWNPLADADLYTIQWSTDSSFAGTPASATTASTAYSLSSSMLTRGAPWFWRVKASQSSGVDTAWSSALLGFTIDWPLSARPQLLKPDHDPTGATPVSDVELTWNPVDGANKYKVYIAIDGAFSSMVAGSPFTVTSPRYSPARTLPNAGYYWRVTALDPANNEGPASLARQFTRSWGPTTASSMTAGELPAVPTGLSPAYAPTPGVLTATSGTVTRNDFVLSWNAVPRASAYEVWLTAEQDTSTLFTDNSKILKCITPNTRLTSFESTGLYTGTGTASNNIKFSSTFGCFEGLGTSPWTNGTTFRWRVRGLDLAATDVLGHAPPANPIYTPWSDRDVVGDMPTLVVTTGTGATPAHPRVPTLVSPAPDAVTTDTPELRWTHIDDAPDGYWVQIYMGLGFTNPVAYFHTYSNRLQINGALLDNDSGQGYYWRVGGCTAFPICANPSEVQQPARRFFKTGAQVPLPTVSVPADPDVPATEDAVRFSWADHHTTSPTSGGIRGYELQVAEDAEFSRLITGFTGLKVDQPFVSTQASLLADRGYFVRVRAIDGVGEGLPWSPARSFTKNSVRAVQVATGTVPFANAPKFSWSAVPGTSKYDVLIETSVGTTVLTKTNLVGNSFVPTAVLTPGSYTWRVRRTDASNNLLAWSAASPFNIGLPSGDDVSLTAPSDTASLAPGNRLFSWAYKPGAVRYQFQTSTSSAFTTTEEDVTISQLSYVPVEDYLASTTYYWRVLPLDANDESLSTPAGARTFTVLNTPGRPVITVTSSGTTVTVAWTTPNAGGSPITGWEVRFRPVGTTTWTETTRPADTSSLALLGLATSTTYEAQVAATNAIGTGVYSAKASKATHTFPNTPGGLKATPGISTLAVSWSAPNNGGTPITGYTVRYGPFGGAMTSIDVTSTSTLLSGLVSGTTYIVDVAARNVVGTGAFASVVSAAVLAPAAPAAPAVAPATPPKVTVPAKAAATGSVENTSPILKEVWDRDLATAASGGGFVTSASAGARATIKFTGTSAQLLAATGPDSGIATVRIDNLPPVAVNLYRPRAGHRTVVFNKAGLKAGAHTMTVTVAGTKAAQSRGTAVNLDAVKAGSTLLQENHSSWTTSFRRVSATTASGRSYDTERQVAAGDTGGKAAYSATFTGTSVTAFFTKTATSGRADIVIDGKKVGSVDLYSRTTAYKVAAFTTTLSPGSHTITISLTGAKATASKGTDVGLDYLMAS